MSELAKKIIAKAKAERATSIDLGNCGLTAIPEELFELEDLREVNFGSGFIKQGELSRPSSNKGEVNQITDSGIPEGHTIQWEGLYLEDTDLDTQNLRDLFSLVNLKHLRLSSCNISKLTGLERLRNLEILDISSNPIPNHELSVLSKLKDLKRLNISYTDCDDLRVVAQLLTLNQLKVNQTRARNFEVLRQLKELVALDLSNNEIENLDFLKTFKESKIEELFLDYNRLKNLNGIDRLSELVFLSVDRNQIDDLSPVGNLKKLKHLFAARNKIADLTPLSQSSSLVILWANGNELTNLKPFLPLLRRGADLSVDNNPLNYPPPEIAEKGNEAIINYFDELEQQGTTTLQEAKMIVVGKGGAGKTSLITKLMDRSAPLPKEEETTKGIDIHTYRFKNAEQRDFTVNMWDFGGQEIYHSTHQFFLTKRSLYVLLDDTREDDKTVNDATFKYWLQTAELFGGGSPLLLFQNNKGGRSKDIDLPGMQGKFGFVKELHADDLRSPGKGLKKFEKDLRHFVQGLPHVGQKLPKQWVEIRNELQRLEKDRAYLSQADYFKICETNGILESDRALSLSSYLHDLGTFLHFQSDPLLRKTVFLDNNWVTDAVYRILDDEKIKSKRGVLTMEDTKRIWVDATYRDMHHELIQLMVNFELCYRLELKKETYLLPQLLSESRPKSLTWDKTDNLQLKLTYGFMPKGLLSRFMVRLNDYIQDRTKAWKNGVVLQKEDTQALVEELFAENTITVRVKGPDQSGLMAIVEDRLEQIHTLFEGIDVEKFIPCNCGQCAFSEEPHFFSHDSIRRRYKIRKSSIECDKSFQNVPVLSLVDNFSTKWLEDEREVIIREVIAKNKKPAQSSPALRVKVKNLTINEQPSEPVTLPTTVTIGKDPSDAQYQQKGNLPREDDGPKFQRKASMPRSVVATQPTKWYQSWWMQKIFAALGASTFIGIGAAIFTSFNPFLTTYVAFGVLAIFLLWRGNPERRFFYTATYVLSVAVGLIALQLGLALDYQKNLPDGFIKASFNWLSEYDWLFIPLLLLLSATLFYLDWKKERV